MPIDSARRVRFAAPYLLGAAGLIVLLVAATSFVGSHGYGFDFRAYDEAARRIASGLPLYPADTVARYNAHLYTDLYVYPPQMAMALVPLTTLDQASATFVWLWLRVGLLLSGCAILPVRPWVRIATLGIAGLSFPVLYDLNLGNISLVVFALSAVVWRLGSNPIAGVVLAVLVAIRYPFAAVGIAWLAMGRWQTLALTIASGLILVVLALPIVGIGGYTDYLTILRNLKDISTGPDNLSVDASLRGVGLPGGISSIVGLASVAVAAGFTWWVARTRDADTATVVALTAPLLVAPFFHPHYLVALLIPAAFLADRGRPWGLLLPLLAWLPGPILPVLCAAGLVAPLLAPDRGTTSGHASGHTSGQTLPAVSAGD